MAIYQTDAVFRRMIEIILNDIRENPYVIQDALSDFVNDDMLSIYGQDEIDNAKKWFKENKVAVFLEHRLDMVTYPCVTVQINGHEERKELARTGDLTATVETYTASEIGKTISYVVEPFDYISYDQVNGHFITPPEVDLTIIEKGMVFIDSKGVGFIVDSVNNTGILIAPGTAVTATRMGVLPEYRIFKLRREIATFQETVTIGCHSHGDPSTNLWLHTIILYGLLRYREGMLESRNFQLATYSSSEMMKSENFGNGGENGYSRFITIKGIVENTWIKAPKRVLETTGASPAIIIIDCDGNKITQI